MIDLSVLQNKCVGVFGLGKSGVSTARALSAAGAAVYAWDDSKEGRGALKACNLSGVVILEPQDWKWKELEMLVLSPGVPLTYPSPHPVVTLAEKAHCRICSDIDLLYMACPDATYVAITGTNGKSTTTALTAHILKESGRCVHMGGNIGIPVCDMDMAGKNDIYVLELSSYQIDLLLPETVFDIAALLNITPDHLDRHGDMQGYVQAKRKLFRHVQHTGTAIIGMDDEYCRDVFEDVRSEGVYVLPLSGEMAGGVAVMSDLTVGQGEMAILSSPPALPGEHNRQNINMACMIASQLKVLPDVIFSSVYSFSGLPHRLQRVAEIEDILFVNDSKATNVAAASHALKCYTHIFWIAGGRGKEDKIEDLLPFYPRVAHAFLIGEAKERFAKALHNHMPLTRCHTLEEAVKEAFAEARVYRVRTGNKPVVLLSPACASFDMFRNFEERGEKFCQLVYSLDKGNKWSAV